jgi:hypothetical protein
MTDGDTYLTLAAPAEGAYREKGQPVPGVCLPRCARKAR